MKKVILPFVLTLLVLVSCSKDDGDEEPEANVPPSEVTRIVAQTIEGTLVRISWDPAIDENNDPVDYDLVINNRVVASKISENSFELDVVSFIPNASNGKNGISNFTLRGFDLVLGIEVKAYDNQGGVSENTEVQTVQINREPNEFELLNVYFDFDNKNSITVNWSKAEDPDGDPIKYDVYLNDFALGTNIVISDLEEFGSLEFNNSIASILTDKSTVKVVAKDDTLAEKVISVDYDFKATDITLNAITLPYGNQLDFQILQSETDSRIGYSFTLEETSSIIFVSDDYINFNLFNEQGQSIGSGSSSIQLLDLQQGDYYLEIVSYNSYDLQSSFYMSARDKDSTDMQLGVLTIPYDSDFFEVILDEGEPDLKMNLHFTLTEESDYVVQNTNYNLNLRLFSSDGEFIAEDGNRIVGSKLQPGEYYFELSRFYVGNYGVSEQIRIQFQNATATDLDLGTKTIPYTETFSYDMSNEIDSTIEYSFTIDTTTDYRFEATNGQISLKDANDNYFNNGENFLYGYALAPGTYIVKLTTYYYYNNQAGDLTIYLDDATKTDTDLGLITTPYQYIQPFELNTSEIDRRQKIYFEVNAASNTLGYSFSTNENVNLNLYDENDNYINGSYNSLTGSNLASGRYYILVYIYNNETASGDLSMNVADATTTDVDLGTLSLPHTSNEVFSIDDNEFDDKIDYYFNITATTTNYSFSSNADVYINLYDEYSNYISGNYQIASGTQLAPGNYKIELVSYSNSTSGELFINLE